MEGISGLEAAPISSSHIPSQDALDFSIDDLLKRIDEYQRRQHLETLERITKENAWLEFHIARHQRNSTDTLNLLQEIHTAVIRMQEALERCLLEAMKANQAWLAFWGIREHPNTAPASHPAGWI